MNQDWKLTLKTSRLGPPILTALYVRDGRYTVRNWLVVVIVGVGWGSEASISKFDVGITSEWSDGGAKPLTQTPAEY
jgi:hypothetical protein